MTRLRLVLKDKSGVDDEKIKSIPGVVGIMRKSGQYQIIIGNNVAKCFAEFNKLGNFADESASGAKKAKGKRKINPVSAVSVREGLIDEVGGIKEALAKLYELIEAGKKEK